MKKLNICIQIFNIYLARPSLKNHFVMLLKKETPKKSKYIIDIKNYTIKKLIQTGGFGSVYLVENKSTKEQFAAKVIIAPDDTAKFKKMINLEIGILIRCQHPTIIQFIGYSTQDFYDQNNVTIIMEHAKNGSLEDILKKVKKSLADINYNNTTRQIILIGIAHAMKHLHQNNIIHRDLKPGNVLIDDEFHPKVTDFGLSKFNETVLSTLQSMQCGTNIYMAPEMIDQKKCSGKVDVYSFGILMYEVVTDQIPFPPFAQGKMKLQTLHQKIVNENYRPDFNAYVKKSIKNLIERCWSKDPSERPTFDEIFKKLAYNIEDSIYDIDDDEDLGENKYYLDGADEDEILSYVDEIEDENNSNDLIEKVYQKLDQFESEIKSLKEENSRLVNENKTLNKSISNLKTKMKEVNQSIKDIQNENEELKNAIEQCENKREEMNKNIITFIDENKQLKNENREQKEMIENYQIENNSIKKKIFRLKQKLFSDIEYEPFKASNSQLIDELKEAIVNLKTSIDDFNKLSLKSQCEIISIIMKDDPDLDPFFIKLYELFVYLLELDQNKSKFGLQIYQIINDENQILIPSNLIKELFKPNVSSISQFCDIICYVNNISIELKYPSDYFFKALKEFNELKNYKYHKTLKLYKKREKEKNKKAEKKYGIKIKIAVFVTGISSTDNGLIGNSRIDSIKFDSSVTQIGSTYSSFLLISLTNGPFENCSSLTEVEIPSSVTLIGYKAFYCCKSLCKVIIPESVITIDQYAFAYCSSLSEIKIPQSVATIGDYAFYDCAPSFQVLAPIKLNNINMKAFPSDVKINRY